MIIFLLYNWILHNNFLIMSIKLFKLDSSVNSRDDIFDRYNEPFSEFWVIHRLNNESPNYKNIEILVNHISQT